MIGLRLEGWRSGIAKQIAFWLLLLFVFGATVKGIDNACHLGGVVSGCLVATAWRRGVKYSVRGTFAAIGLSSALCLASAVAVIWRDASDPFALLGPNDRGHLIQLSLAKHDCAAARRALVATEAVAEASPELEGLRAQVDRECPPGARRRVGRGRLGHGSGSQESRSDRLHHRVRRDRVGESNDHVDDPVVIQIDGAKAHREKKENRQHPPWAPEVRPAEQQELRGIGHVKRGDRTEDVVRSPVQPGEKRDTEDRVDPRPGSAPRSRG